MNPQDFLYIVLGIGFIVIVICVVYLTYLISITIKHLHSIINKIADTTSDISMLKDGVKYAAINFVSGLLGRVRKRGGGTNG